MFINQGISLYGEKRFPSVLKLTNDFDFFPREFKKKKEYSNINFRKLMKEKGKKALFLKNNFDILMNDLNVYS